MPEPTTTEFAADPQQDGGAEAGDRRGDLDGVRSGDPGQHLGARADLRRRRRRRRAWRCVTMTLTAPGCPGGAVAAGRSRARRSRPFPASPTPRSTSCGSRAGRRTGCRTRRSCNWVWCRSHRVRFRLRRKDYYAATLQKSRLRADGDEAPRHAHRSRVGKRARDCRAVRHSGRADGQGAAAAGAARPADVASGHARRIPAGARRRARSRSPTSSRRSTVR